MDRLRKPLPNCVHLPEASQLDLCKPNWIRGQEPHIRSLEWGSVKGHRWVDSQGERFCRGQFLFLHSSCGPTSDTMLSCLGPNLGTNSFDSILCNHKILLFCSNNDIVLWRVTIQKTDHVLKWIPWRNDAESKIQAVAFQYPSLESVAEKKVQLLVISEYSGKRLMPLHSQC